MTELACTWNEANISAVAVYTGENRLVNVKGTVFCPTPGFIITVELDNEGIVDDPEVLVLKVVESAPTDPVAEVQTRTTFEGTFEDPATRVVIRGLKVTLNVTVEVVEPA
jgi:hypothetical protein